MYYEWTQEVDISDRVDFKVPAGHSYTNTFVVAEYDDEYRAEWYYDHDGNELTARYYVVVYDGWNGKHSGGSEVYILPQNWELL